MATSDVMGVRQPTGNQLVNPSSPSAVDDTSNGLSDGEANNSFNLRDNSLLSDEKEDESQEAAAADRLTTNSLEAAYSASEDGVKGESRTTFLEFDEKNGNKNLKFLFDEIRTHIFTFTQTT